MMDEKLGKNGTMDEILEKMVTQWMKIKHE